MQKQRRVALDGQYCLTRDGRLPHSLEEWSRRETEAEQYYQYIYSTQLSRLTTLTSWGQQIIVGWGKHT